MAKKTLSSSDASGLCPASDLRPLSELIEPLRPVASLSYYPAPSCPGPLTRQVANELETGGADSPLPAPSF